jgi:hypothetical protein
MDITQYIFMDTSSGAHLSAILIKKICYWKIILEISNLEALFKLHIFMPAYMLTSPLFGKV